MNVSYPLMENLGPIVNDNSFFRRSLTNYSNCLKIGHVNIQSLKPTLRASKFDEFKFILNDSLIDIFAVSETWLKSRITDSSIAVPHYYVIRNDREDNIRAGGVAFYVREGISTKLIKKVSNPETFEYLFIEVDNGNSKTLVGVVYSPHGKIRQLDKVLGELCCRYDNIIILGDFNHNLFNSEKANLIRNLCQTANLSYCHNSMPTHFDMRHCSTSLIDYVLVSDINLVKCSGQFFAPSLTHHSFIYVCIDIPVTIKNKVIEYKDYEAIDWNMIEESVSSGSWNEIYDTSNINHQLENFYQLLFTLHDTVPMRRKRIYNGTNFCNILEVKVARNIRDLAFKAYKENVNDDSWRTYCKYRNRVKSILRKYKTKYWIAKFDNCSSTDMWKLINSKRLNKPNSPFDRHDPEVLNNYFISSQINANDRPLDFQNFSDIGFNFRCINRDELLYSISRIKSNAVGPDELPIKFVKKVYPYIENYLLFIFNTILTTSHYPELWKTSRIVPIKKNCRATGLDNFRPISILCCLSKAFEIILKDQILDHLNSEKLLSDCHFGFRTGASTSSLLLSLTEKVRHNINSKNISTLVSLDLSKAFDTVNYNVLTEKLSSKFGFSSSSCKLMHSYITERFQFVGLNGNNSSLMQCCSGVPQGSVLGPLLFLMYVNDFIEYIGSSLCQSFLFADDINLLFTGDKQFLDCHEATINYVLSQASNWAVRNKLRFNPDKTKAIVFGYFDNPNNFINIFFNDVPVQFVDDMKCLGVTLDSGLTFNSHVSAVEAKVCGTLRALYNLDVFLPIHIKIKLAHSLLMTHILYCLDVYSGTTKTTFQRLRRIYNRILRYIFGLRVFDPVSNYSLNFIHCTFRDFTNIRVLLTLHRMIIMQAPSSIVICFHFSRSTRNPELIMPRINNSIFEKSFLVRASRLWNSLPRNLKTFSHSNSVTKNKYLDYFSNVY